MATETTTLTLCLDHLYYLTADSNNTTGYTVDEVRQMIDEKGGDFQIEATITHPVPPPYTVEWDIENHQQRINNDEGHLIYLQEKLSSFEEGTEEYINIQTQIDSYEEDIKFCLEYIRSLQNN